jgi:hypothetical protein
MTYECAVCQTPLRGNALRWEFRVVTLNGAEAKVCPACFQDWRRAMFGTRPHAPRQQHVPSSSEDGK